VRLVALRLCLDGVRKVSKEEESDGSAMIYLSV
jgi:hypothetical protein